MDSQWPINNVEVVQLYRSDTNKEGKPFVSSKGNAFQKVDIHIDPRLVDDVDFKGKMSYFDYFGNTENWAIGSTITGIVVKNGQYFNFQLPASGKKALELDIKQLEDRIKKLEDKVFGQTMGHTEEVRGAMDFSKEVLEEKDEIEDTIEDDMLPF
jgi:hypothetical protein